MTSYRDPNKKETFAETRLYDLKGSSCLFEVQLLCLSLHIEVLSFEDSEWSCGLCKMEKLEHFLLFGLSHFFLFLMLA